MAINLKGALRVGNDSRIAFVGAGGKTTAMFQLAHQVETSVIVTTSTHLGLDQAQLADQHIVIEDDFPDTFLPGVTLLTGSADGDRWDGLDFLQLEALNQLATALNLPILIEADGSRQLSLKAPAEHEPALPSFINTLVVVAGLSGVGQQLNKEVVHRPEEFAKLSGLAQGEIITAQALARVLIDKEGGLKYSEMESVPRKIALLNQADDVAGVGLGGRVGRLIAPHFDAVVISSLAQENVWAVQQRVGGVVLAGGQSVRLGEPKQLLAWQGEPFVRVVAKNALAAGLDPVVVVTGAYHEQVVPLIEDLPVLIQYNPDWADGQSTSVKAGLNVIPDNVGAVLFLLIDQPQTPPELIRALIEMRTNTLAPVVLPMADGRRTTPVLFGAETFPDFQSLTGDAGARTLFSRYSLTYVPWANPVVAMDVDTLIDYQRLLNYEDD